MYSIYPGHPLLQKTCFGKCNVSRCYVHSLQNIAPDKVAYCVFTQLLGPKNANKLFVFVYNTGNCRVQIYTRHGAKSSILNCKPVQEHSYRCLAVPNLHNNDIHLTLR